jgi:hypothetical protein
MRAEFRRDPALPILVGDDLFVKAIRRGIELGEYVYQSGDLTCGKGDPWASIHIDEQSFVHTAEHAKMNGIWPKVAEPTGPTAGVTTGRGAGTTGGAGTATGGAGSGAGVIGGVTAGGTAIGTGSTVSVAPESNTLTEEGVLKEALTKLWERARARKLTHIRAVDLKLFDPADAFRLLGLVGAIQQADKKVVMAGGYETTDGGIMELTFEGSPADAQPVKDFLDPQLRAAKDKDLSVTFSIAFADDGLSLAGDAPEKLAERLTNFGTGAAYVAITAEGGL